MYIPSTVNKQEFILSRFIEELNKRRNEILKNPDCYVDGNINIACGKSCLYFEFQKEVEEYDLVIIELKKSLELIKK